MVDVEEIYEPEWVAWFRLTPRIDVVAPTIRYPRPGFEPRGFPG